MTSEAEDDFIYSYGIVPLPTTLRSGWCLRLYANRTMVAEQHFPVGPANLAACVDWWQSLTDAERTESMAACTGFADAYRAHLVAVAYAHAETVACAWLDARAGA